jgi:mannose-1-phosphate guanylyltransferase
MNRTANRWAIVLGAGDGTRLSALTTLRGVAVPKQYCQLNGGPSLLELAVRRAGRVVPADRVAVVVARAHRAWWEKDLAALPPDNVVVQPANRGTAAGVLLPLANVWARDPDARIAVLPSDHWVANEEVLAERIDAAFEAVERDPESVVLLGIEADAPDTGYGWILSGPEATHGVRTVEAFVEKPDPSTARELFANGAVWNSFLMVASARALWRLYERRLPALADRFAALHADGEPPCAAYDVLYADLAVNDFSRDLLQGAEPDLRLLAVPRCGWSDLGTPERLALCVEQLHLRPVAPPRHATRPARVDLLWALASV